MLVTFFLLLQAPVKPWIRVMNVKITIDIQFITVKAGVSTENGNPDQKEKIGVTDEGTGLETEIDRMGETGWDIIRLWDLHCILVGFKMRGRRISRVLTLTSWNDWYDAGLEFGSMIIDNQSPASGTFGVKFSFCGCLLGMKAASQRPDNSSDIWLVNDNRLIIILYMVPIRWL